jgi:hypothetical protein
MSNSTQNDWEDEIKDMLSDAGLKPIHFKLNNSGVRILNRIREELADARKEMISKVESLPQYWDLDGDRLCVKRSDVLATLREEEGL